MKKTIQARNNDVWIKLAVFCILWVCLISGKIFAIEECLKGKIEFSDGKVVTGEITLAKPLQLQEETKVHTIPLARIREIQMSPEREEMAEMWRFAEPGKPNKEKYGEKYPVRYLRCTILLSDQSRIVGHLYTTVLYLQKEGQTEKVILLYKQTGKQGQDLKSLVYPARICFEQAESIKSPSEQTDFTKTPSEQKESDKSPSNKDIVNDTQANSGVAETKNGHGDNSAVRIAFADKNPLSPNSIVCLISANGMLRFEATKTEKGEWQIASPVEGRIFAAIQNRNTILVGWKEKSDKKLTVLTQTSLSFVRDFFDEKQLLGLYQEDSETDVYSLMMLKRKAQTTLNQKKNKPWRIEVWHWKYDTEENKLTLAGRQYFFRGIVSDSESLPKIVLKESLWEIERH